MSNTSLIGPFKQILSLDNLPLKGAIQDKTLEIFENAGLLIQDGKITEIGNFEQLLQKAEKQAFELQLMQGDLVLLPGLVDCHTHLCYAGSRAKDYAMRIAGKAYLEIAKAGGGILDSMRKTRESGFENLYEYTFQRAKRHFWEGITTCEIKSGYGLSFDSELKMLEVIRKVNENLALDIIPTCLAAHICPPEFENSEKYLDFVAKNLLPEIKKRKLSNRVDLFLEETAFTYSEAKKYLQKAQKMGFSVVIHADQFSTEGSRLAVEISALSADHLEASSEKEINLLAKSEVVCVVLPGASLGLGMSFAPARKMMDEGCCVAIATDWNPGSAPMGDLLMQAAILGAAQKLTAAETFAGMTFRAAQALELKDRGILAEGLIADMIAFPCDNYKEILYQQGKLKPKFIWKKGILNHQNNL